jgi:hypothetical protein
VSVTWLIGQEQTPETFDVIYVAAGAKRIKTPYFWANGSELERIQPKEKK